MESEKSALYFGSSHATHDLDLVADKTTPDSHPPSSSGQDTIQPPPYSNIPPSNSGQDTMQQTPYSDNPPSYSEATGNSTYNYSNIPLSHDYSNIPLNHDYMAKLPFGQTDDSFSHQSSLRMQGFAEQPTSLQDSAWYPPTSHQTQQRQQDYLQRPTSLQETTRNPPTQPVNNPSASSPISPGDTIPTAPHKFLLQPSSSRIVETKDIGHRKKESRVKDLETGKEYIVIEKTSRHGRRSKATIQEVGGPKIHVKETPSRMVVCQKKH